MRRIVLFTAIMAMSMAVQSQVEAHRCQSAKRSLPLRGGSVVEDPGNARSDTLDILHYDISLDFTLMEDELLYASCAITFQALMDDIQMMHLDLLGLTVDSITSPNGMLEYAQSGENLYVQFGEPLNSGDQEQLTVFYHGSPAADPMWGGFYFSSGYAYNLGVGFESVPHNLGRVWFPCFDNFVERSTYSFHVLTNENRTAYCNGLLMNTEVAGADSAIYHWQLSESIPTYLACVAVSNYTHTTQNYESISGDVIPMWLVAKAIDTTDMKLSMANLPLCLSGFEDDYGPYRWQRVGFTAVPFNSGAMEHATSIAYPLITLDGTTTYETLMAHELSHHWWGDLVTCRNAGDMWLNEGWATFSEGIFLENLYGPEEYADHFKDLLKEVLLYAHRNDGERYPVSGVPNTATYGDHVYKKGALMAHNLRVYMGDENFFNAIRDMMNERAFTHHTSADLRDYFQQYTSADLTGFFNHWVFEPGFPEFRIKAFTPVSGNTWEVHIDQFQHYSGGFYENVPIELTAREFSGEIWTTQILAGGEQTIVSVTLPEAFAPEVFFLNASERLKYAVLAEQKTITDDGINNFTYAEMELDVETMGDMNGFFMRVENHWAAADDDLVQGDYYISPDRWWNVWHNATASTELVATIRYYGNPDDSKYFDPLLFDYLEVNEYNEDSLVLLYRPDGMSDWQPFSNYEVLTSPGIDNWAGRIRIFGLASGQYAFAAPTGPSSISEFSASAQTIYYNNRRIACRTGKVQGVLSIYNTTGGLVIEKATMDNVDISTHDWPAGVYIARWSAVNEEEEISVKLVID